MSEIKIKTNVKKVRICPSKAQGRFFVRGGWDEANGERRKNVSKRE